MTTLILKSNDEAALQQLKVHALELHVAVEEIGLSGEKAEYWNQVKAKGQSFNLDEIAGSLSDLNLDAAELRKNAWQRKKSQF